MGKAIKISKNNTSPNKGLNARQAEVLNSTFVLLFGFCAKLKICASNPAQRQAPNRWLQLLTHPTKHEV